MTEHAGADAEPSVDLKATEPQSLQDRLQLDFDLGDYVRAIADGHPRAAALYARIINEGILQLAWKGSKAEERYEEEAKAAKEKHFENWDFSFLLKRLNMHDPHGTLPRNAMRKVADYANGAVHYQRSGTFDFDELRGLHKNFRHVIEWFANEYGPITDDLSHLADALPASSHDLPRDAVIDPKGVSSPPTPSYVLPRSHGFIRCGDGLVVAVPNDGGLTLQRMGTGGSLPAAVWAAGHGFVLTERGSLAVTLTSGRLSLEVVGTDPSGNQLVVADHRTMGVPNDATLLAASRRGRLAARCLVSDASSAQFWAVTARSQIPSVQQVCDGNVTLGVIVDDATVLTAEGNEGFAGSELRELFPGLERILSIDRIPARAGGVVAVLGADVSGRLRAQVRRGDRSLALDEPVDPRATQVAIARDLGRRYPSTLVAVSTPTDVELFDREARP